MRAIVRSLGRVVVLTAALGGLASHAGRSGQAHATAGAELRFAPGMLAIVASGDVGRALRGDARLIPGFTLFDPSKIPPQLRRATKAKDFDAKAWSELGVVAVITANVEGDDLELAAHDLVKRASAVVGGHYPADRGRQAAHRFMNELMVYYTGIPGVFGSRIVYVRPRRSPVHTKNVMTMDMAGGGVEAVTNTLAFDVFPSLGPGGEVLFTSYARGNPDLWIRDDQGRRRLSTQAGLNAEGVISPRGDRIAVTLAKDGDREIYLLDRAGAIKTRLTEHRGMDESPSWSPDGSELAFTSDRMGGPQVFRIAANGGGPSRLTTDAAIHPRPDWSPADAESDVVAYTARGKKRRDIFKVDLATRTKTQLTFDGDATDASWSPDGRKLAYASARRGGIIIVEEGFKDGVLIKRGAEAPDWGPANPSTMPK